MVDVAAFLPAFDALRSARSTDVVAAATAQLNQLISSPDSPPVLVQVLRETADPFVLQAAALFMDECLRWLMPRLTPEDLLWVQSELLAVLLSDAAPRLCDGPLTETIRAILSGIAACSDDVRNFVLE
jgi:hypothetical protein